MEKKKSSQFKSPEEFEDFMSGVPVEEDHSAEEPEPVAPKAEDDLEEMPLPEMREEEEKEEDILSIAADVPVQVVAVLGKKNIKVREIALLRQGEVINLERPANEIVDLVAGGKLIAKGELVDIEGKLGVRIVKMLK